jgi:hypothetical protein
MFGKLIAVPCGAALEIYQASIPKTFRSGARKAARSPSKRHKPRLMPLTFSRRRAWLGRIICGENTEVLSGFPDACKALSAERGTDSVQRIGPRSQHKNT